jgi:hypothetical protein
MDAITGVAMDGKIEQLQNDLLRKHVILFGLIFAVGHLTF